MTGYDSLAFTRPIYDFSGISQEDALKTVFSGPWKKAGTGYQHFINTHAARDFHSLK
jgi:hypothetical protein